MFRSRIIRLLEAYKKYVEWWLPIDAASDSALAPMSFLSFCESLITREDEEWFHRWSNGEFLKSDVLKLIKADCYNIINLNEKQLDIYDIYNY